MSNVKIETGLPEFEQESDFMNSTLQSAGPNLAFSIATELDIPESVSSQGEDAVAAYIRTVLSCAANAAAEYGLVFDVQVGPSRDAWRDR